MRCTHCGSIIPPGVPRCPICGALLDSSQAQEDYRLHQRYPKTNIPQNAPADREYGYPPEDGVSRANPYAQGAPPNRDFGNAADDGANRPNRYATPAFHTYRRQILTGFPQTQQASYEGQSRDSFNPGSAFSKALSDLPQVVKGAFLNPTGTLQGMIRREDRYTGVILLFLSLVFAFLAGMILTKGVLGTVFAATGGIAGLQLADSAASLNQSVSYLAGKIAIPVGGIAALCQLIAATVPAAVTLMYLRALKQMRLSFLLLLGLIAVAALPNLAALVLASVFSLITPYISLFILLFGQIVSYVLLCTMAGQLANLKPQRAVLTLASMICLSELVKWVLIALAASAMLGGVLRTLTGLTGSMNGLL